MSVNLQRPGARGPGGPAGQRLLTSRPRVYIPRLLQIGHVLVGDPVVDDQDTPIGMLESMGVAPTTIQALSDAGFATVDAVAYAGRDAVAQVEGIGEGRVDGILGKAAEVVGQNSHATAFYAKFGSSLKSRTWPLAGLAKQSASIVPQAVVLFV